MTYCIDPCHETSLFHDFSLLKYNIAQADNQVKFFSVSGICNVHSLLFSILPLILWIKQLYIQETAIQGRRIQIICLCIILISFGILRGTTAQAQESAHASGSDGTSSAGSVAFSVGQVVYTTYSLPVGTESQGVQQRYELVQVKSATEPSLVQTNWSKDPVLPTKVTIVITEGQSFQVGVTWDKSTLNIFARGTYTLFGDLSLSSYIGNMNKVRAQIKVQVLPKPAPLDVTLNNNSIKADNNNFFFPVGAFEVTDPADNIHVVSLNGSGYDNSYFFIKDNILFWNSADPAAGKDSFTILIRVTDRDGNTLEKFFEITRIRPDFTALRITNAFSPTGDGANDTWGVPDLRVYEGVRISVYDRGGVRMFYTENPDIRWDGTYEGKDMPIGSYFWTIEVIETGEMRRGMLNLIRK